MAGLKNTFKSILVNIDRIVSFYYTPKLPPYCYALANIHPTTLPTKLNERPSILDRLKESIVWAVPKHRRSIFRRRIRRFGSPEGWLKIMLPKTNLLICDDCGGYREAGLLCPTCYDKVRVLTEEMQEKIQQELGLNPVDKEVVVLFDGEEVDRQSDFYKGKRIIEMKRERPSWFSKNLLQSSTQAPATTTNVEPKNLA